MQHALVFGGSGQIGLPLLTLLRRDGWRISALSREAHAEEPGLQWLHGSFDRLPVLPARVDAIFSCGPLDRFAEWYAGSDLGARRVIAFGSTSADTKRASADAGERDLSRRLRTAEDTVFGVAQQRGAAATLLRPTLVYGAARDATLTRIAGIARRWGRLPLPRRAYGLRQPVHVDDLATAAHTCLLNGATAGQTYALAGGESLRYRDMIARVLEVMEPPPTLIELPSPLFELALGAARMTGRAAGLGEAAVRRMRSDLVFDIGPAQRDFGYAPRMFRPTWEMFDTRPAQVHR